MFCIFRYNGKRAISIRNFFLFLDSITSEKIKVKLDTVYVDPSPYMTTIFSEERTGRPTDAVIVETVEKVHDMIFTDRRTKVAETLGV